MKKAAIIIVLLSSYFLIAQTPSIKEQRLDHDSSLPELSNEEFYLSSESFEKERDKALSEFGKSDARLTKDMKAEPAPFLIYFDAMFKQTKEELAKKRKIVLQQTTLEEIKEKNKIVESLKTDRKSFKKLVRLLRNEVYNFGTVLPTYRRNNVQVRNFYGQLYSKKKEDNLYLVNNTSYRFNDGGSIIRSELLSAYLLGLRVSLGTVITTENNEDGDEENSQMNQNDPPINKTEAFKRLIAGGNTYLDLELPVLLYKRDNTTFYWNTNLGFNLAIDAFSNDIQNAQFNANIGTRIYGSLSSQNKEFLFYGTMNGGLYIGEKSFYQSLELENKGFLFGQVQLGVVVKENLKLTFDVATFSTEDALRSGSVVIGAQILTDFLLDGKKDDK